MAAQGKSNPDETFDVPSAHNGFAGIRSHHFEEELEVSGGEAATRSPANPLKRFRALIEPQHAPTC